jgi:nucleotide-binding universal stress UspA family protein
MSSSVEPASGQQRTLAGRIVVGLDGSPGSVAALRWAASEARLRAVPVEVVIAWAAPPMYGYSALYSTEDFQADATAALQQALDGVRDELAGIEVVTTVGEGRPAAVLLAAAEGAAMLVVGSRGHGAFAGMLLGSVSQHCVQNASGVVVVVRD